MATPARVWKMPFRIIKSPAGLHFGMNLFIPTPAKKEEKQKDIFYKTARIAETAYGHTCSSNVILMSLPGNPKLKAEKMGDARKLARTLSMNTYILREMAKNI